MKLNFNNHLTNKMMKKSILLTAFACIAFASCTNDENFYENVQQEISFTPVQHLNQSRTDATQGALATDVHFGVFAWYGTKDATINTNAYMENVEISYSKSKWQPASPYYWLKNNSISFVAYAPYTAESAEHIFLPVFTVNETTSSNKINYKDVVIDPTDNDNSKDIMYSNKTAELTGNTQDFTPSSEASQYQGVPIIFNHALAKVSFKFKNATLTDESKSTTWEVTVTKCTLGKIGTKGSVELTLNENKQDWDLPSNNIWAPVNSKKDWVLCDSQTSSDSKLVLNGEFQALKENILVIPQATENIVLDIAYSVKTTLPNQNAITENFTHKISDISKINSILYWAMNKHITDRKSVV